MSTGGEDGWSSTSGETSSRPGSLASSAPGSPPVPNVPMSHARKDSYAAINSSRSGSSLSTVREGPSSETTAASPAPSAATLAPGPRGPSQPVASTSRSPAPTPPSSEPVSRAPSSLGPLPELPPMAAMPTFDLSDVGPVPPPTPPPEPPSLPTDQTFEDLKKSDALQRRASKRFSQYTYTRMTAGPSPSPSMLGMPAVPSTPVLGGPTASTSSSALSPDAADTTAGRELVQNSRRTRMQELGQKAVALPSGLPASPRPVGKAATRLSTTHERDEEEATAKQEGSPEKVAAPTTVEPDTSPAPALAAPIALASSSAPSRSGSLTQISRASSPSSRERTVYLQLGRDVKRAKLEGEPTIASLRLLFIDRFAYNPGLSDFPAIYVRDSSHGVQYELEDMAEIRDGTVLSLNIERACSYCDRG